jgi:cation:H+ antiporter
VLTGELTASDGVILLALFVTFIGYVLVQELRSTTPVFRNAEVLEAVASATVTEKTNATSASSITDTVVVERPTDQPPFEVRPLPDWAGVAFAVLALVGLVAAAAVTSQGIEGILDDFSIEGTLFGATIATLVLSIEDIFLTVEPNRRGASEIGIGNVIGSVVFGVTAKLGIILLTGGSIETDDDVLAWHLPVLIGMTALGAYFISTGRLRRHQGFLLLALYIAYWVISYTVFGEAPIEAD